MYDHRKIGTAWHGRHVVIVRCNSNNNQLIGIHKSLHAQTEPPSINCTETLAQLLSIGYVITDTHFVPPNEIHYILVK
jgi:hypothetical protein